MVTASSRRRAKDIVIVDTIFELLHERHRLAVDDLAGPEHPTRNDETIHVTAIAAIGTDDESIREWVRARNDFAVPKLQGLFVVMVLSIRARLVLHEHVNLRLRSWLVSLNRFGVDPRQPVRSQTPV
jgi:hypothetical protein